MDFRVDQAVELLSRTPGGQIVQTLAKQYREAIGPWRRFVPIVDR